jgi:pimeloyl-ACP methyl ester carboxylesterase
MAPLRPVEHTLDADGVTLNYAELPDEGPTILMLHGLGARWQVFAPLFSGLRGYGHLLALDFRGHGQSARVPHSYRLGDFCSDALSLLRQAGPPGILYGHSMGGWVALALAAAHPGDVRAVIVAESAIFPENIDPDLAVSYLADLPIALRSLAKSLNQLDPEVMAFFRDGRMTGDYDPASLLGRVTCPVLLLQGDPKRDGLMTDRDVQRAMSLLPDARHVYFPGLGHGLHVEDFNQVLNVVQPFVRKQSSGQWPASTASC